MTKFSQIGAKREYYLGQNSVYCGQAGTDEASAKAQRGELEEAAEEVRDVQKRVADGRAGAF